MYEEIAFLARRVFPADALACSMLVTWLCLAGEQATAAGATARQILPWLEILTHAADPDRAARQAASDELPGWAPGAIGWSRMPASLSALAWAAGATPGEAALRWRAGTLREGGLRTLAALRGFRIAG